MEAPLLYITMVEFYYDFEYPFACGGELHSRFGIFNSSIDF